MILLYNILRNLFTVFHSGCTILPPHQQWRSLSSPPRSHQHLLCLVFLMLAMLTFVRLNFILVLICIFLMISDIEHLSCVCWPSVCFLWKCVYQGPLFIFKSGFVFFFLFWNAGLRSHISCTSQLIFLIFKLFSILMFIQLWEEMTMYVFNFINKIKLGNLVMISELKVKF